MTAATEIVRDTARDPLLTSERLESSRTVRLVMEQIVKLS